MSIQPRRIFQLDGIDGGVLSIAERPDQNIVLLVISTQHGEARIALSGEGFIGLADLRYSLRLGHTEPQADIAALKAVA